MLSAFSVGFAFITRPTSILVIPPLCIMMIVYYSKQFSFKETVKLITKNIALFSIGFLPFLGLFLWCNYYRFGSIFETGYQLIAARTGIEFFKGTSLFAGLRGLLISPGKGFFYFSPIAVFFFFSIKPFLKKHLGLGMCFIFIIGSYLLFLSKYIFWHGDWAWGPRLMLVVTPFFIMPIAELIDSKKWTKKGFLRTGIYSIFVLSLIIQVAAISIDFRKHFLHLWFHEKVTFSIANGQGAQPVIESPSKIYYDLKRSPILSQFTYIYSIAREIKNYKYAEPPEDASIVEQINISLYTNVFDFWWIYKYYLDKSYSGFIGALVIFFIAIFGAVKLRSLLRNNNGREYSGQN
jgi:hypothetical protein